MGGVLAGVGNIGGEHPGVARAGHLLPFLLASVLVHGLFMAWSARAPQRLPTEPEPRPLSVDLSFPAPAPEPFRPRQPTTGRTVSPRVAPATTSAAPPLSIPNGEHADHGETPSAPVVDIDAARSLARRIGREAKAGGQPPTVHAGTAPPVEDRMAAAVARAYRPGTLVERQTNGGWAVHDGKRRCLIQPRDVPLFLQGMLIIPLCDA